eukprot:42919-Eustigmatos_ZCMA.PRE.1
MIELSRAQDEEVGDGTTSVIIIGGSLCFLAIAPLRSGSAGCGGRCMATTLTLQVCIVSAA